MQTVNQFRQVLLQSLNKLGDQSTIKAANEEVVALMQEHVINSERMNVVIYHLTEFNDTMKSYQRRELIKLIGVAAENFQEKLVPFLPKILAFYSKRIKDADQILH
jgi:leucyl-tRNA synthetase